MERFLHRSALIALAVLVGFAPIAAHAQAPTPGNSNDPFWDLLAMIPDYDESRGLLAYANYQALTEIFDVSGLTYDDVVESIERDEGWPRATFSEQGERWLYAIGIAGTTALNLQGLWMGMADMPATLGFTPLDIHQGVRFGYPSDDGYILTGDFDADAIRAAFTSRDYVRREIAGIEVWCYLDDCTTGEKQDLLNRSQANLFGGFLGRREPIALLPGVFMDSASLDTLQLMLDVPEGNLAEASEFHTLAEAMTAQGTVIQVYAYQSTNLFLWDFTSSDLAEDFREKAVSSAREFGDLPPYRLFAFVHTWRDGDHYGHLILVYDTTEKAEIAAEELHERLTHAQTLGYDRYAPTVFPMPDTYLELFSQTGEILPPAIFEGTDGAAALFTVRAVPDDPNDPLSVIRSSPFHDFEGLGIRNLYVLGVVFIMPD